MTAQTVQNVSMTSYFLYGILIYLAVINIVAFFLYGIDKWKAKRNKWRVTEARLLWLAVAGGSIGALLSMKVWHHKTQHAKFRFGLPAILLLHLAAILAALYCYYFVN